MKFPNMKNEQKHDQLKQKTKKQTKKTLEWEEYEK